MDKPFAKTEQKVLTVTIDENGDLIYLKTSEHDIFAEMGEVVTRRASHVEPRTFWTRVAFHILRTMVNDKSRVAAWTRTWSCDWRVNTAPVGGPILRWKHTGNWRASVFPETVASWQNRQEAIDAEIKFLNDWFLRR